MERIWDDILTDSDKEIYKAAGYGARGGGGEYPALLVVDVTCAFVGDKPEPMEDSVKRFPNSCGEVGWAAMEHIRHLLEIFREKNMPIFYTTGMEERNAVTRGAWSWKKAPGAEQSVGQNPLSNTIPDLVAPNADELVIRKTKPSAFFGTPLLSYLTHLGVDTVVVTGGVTSGCIRATVLDSFSSNLKTIVPEEAVFDRGEISHKINCFDMNAKYADVIPVEDVKMYLKELTTTSSPSA